MNPVKLAIIGGGVIGRRHAHAITKVDHAKLVAISDLADSGRQLAEEMEVPLHPDFRVLLDEEDIDGVIVSTPTEHHFHPTIAALETGRHVLVEKPMMATLDEADKIVDRVESSGFEVLVGHHRRYYGLVHKAREILRAGELGQFVAVNGQWTARKADDYYGPDWRKRWEAGPILTNLIHEMDLLRYICGDVASVSAEISHEVRNWEKEDAAAIILRFVNGAIGTFILSDQATSPWAWEFATGETSFFPRSAQNTLRFMGTKASLDFPNLTLWHHDDDPPNWNHTIEPEEISLPLEDAFVLQIEHLTAIIEGQDRPITSATDGRASLRTTLAVFEAAKFGKKVIL